MAQEQETQADGRGIVEGYVDDANQEFFGRTRGVTQDELRDALIGLLVVAAGSWIIAAQAFGL